MAMLMTYGMMLIIMVVFLGWVWYNLKPPKYNGLLWLHPDHIKASPNIETIIPIKRTPEGQKPFHFGYDWWRWKTWPLYFWYEQDAKIEEIERDGKKIKVKRYPIAHWEPEEPADYMVLEESSHPFVTPNELFDNTDWECARRFESVKSKFAEAVKLGAALVMVIVCVVALIMLVDMVSKKGTPNAQEINFFVNWLVLGGWS